MVAVSSAAVPAAVDSPGCFTALVCRLAFINTCTRLSFHSSYPTHSNGFLFAFGRVLDVLDGRDDCSCGKGLL